MRLREIIFTGPECTGKTTLAEQVAHKYSEPLVQEFARTYLEGIGREYVETDILEIAKGQLRSRERIAPGARHFLIQDTSWLVLKVWSEHKYGHCNPWIDSLFKKSNAIYFLCRPDFPWQQDPLRESENERWILYERYLYWLTTLSKPFHELGGSLKSRLQVIDSTLEKYIPKY
jgi:nicotinamide riboside kinase